MKRPHSTKVPQLVTGDIERDLTPNQLAKIGAIAFTYNEAEAKITDMFGIVTNLSGQLLLEVATRINGLDGLIAVINSGSKGCGISDQTQRMFEETLGESGFQRLKKYREAVVHARLVSAPHGIGKTVERRARVNEVLLSQSALDALYLHLKAMRAELHCAWAVLVTSDALKRSKSDAAKKVLAERDLPNEQARYLECRNQRQALPPIPEFPPESESAEAVSQWITAWLDELQRTHPELAKIRAPKPPYRNLVEVIVDLLEKAVAQQKQKED
jgi:hypothetical protein